MLLNGLKLVQSNSHHLLRTITTRGGGTKMVSKIKVSNVLQGSDPRSTPVVIIGQLEHLKALDFNVIKVKFGGRVDEETFATAVEALHPSASSTDSVSLYLNMATIVGLPNPSTASRYNAPSRAHLMTKALKDLVGHGVDEYIVVVSPLESTLPYASAIAQNYPLYNQKTSSSKDTSAASVTIELLPTNGTLDQPQLSTLQNLIEANRATSRIIDAPCSDLNTDDFVAEAVQVANELGVGIKVIQGEELKLKGMNGIWSVGKAAVNGPALVVLSHEVEAATETVAWVGKGIVYDTGGLSIKTRTGMCGMKRDCGGAAGVLYAFKLAVQSGFTQNLHAVLCLAENSVGPHSTRPDDIIKMYSGKTVEVNNPDAEGRLVVGDGVVYAAKDLKANIILDMATLTGAQKVATGRLHGGLLTNNPEIELACVEAGKRSGDMVFPLLFCPELLFSEFRSEVADMKNAVADASNAASACAGLFIMSHLGFDFPGVWVHLDIAAPAYSGERATGYGVALLNILFGKYSTCQLLKSLSP